MSITDFLSTLAAVVTIAGGVAAVLLYLRRRDRDWRVIVGVVVIMAIVLFIGQTVVHSATGSPGPTPTSTSSPTATIQATDTATLTATATATMPPDPTAQIVASYNQFCDALHAGKFQTAFSYFTTAFQHTVGSPSNVPNAVGGMFGSTQERALDCSQFAPVSVNPDGQRATELGNVVVTDSFYGTHTTARNFSFVLTNGKWLIDNIYNQ